MNFQLMFKKKMFILGASSGFPKYCNQRIRVTTSIPSMFEGGEVW